MQFLSNNILLKRFSDHETVLFEVILARWAMNRCENGLLLILALYTLFYFGNVIFLNHLLMCHLGTLVSIEKQ